MMNTTETSSDIPANPPIAKLRIGLINASIWQRITDEHTFYSVTFERRYRDDQGNWHFTKSFNPEDLLILSKLADQVHTEITIISAVHTD